MIVGLITKTNTNPFFAKMKEGAEAKAKELGVDFRSFAGKYDGDNTGQVDAIEHLMNAGAKAIMITPSDTKAIVPTVERARKAGILVIALDTPLDPMDAADATFQTDNFKAGTLIGQWAAKTLGDKGKDAHIAFIDAIKDQPTVDKARDLGFQKGFGVENSDWKLYGHETDKRVAGHQWGQGSTEGGRKAMETLLQKDPDINVVYTINEPTAAGAYNALKAAGKADTAIVVSVDGGCPGVKNVADGVIGATAQQYPLLMASKEVEAAVEYAKTGKKPKNSRARLLRHRRQSGDGQAGRGRSFDHLEGSPGEVLGLIDAESVMIGAAAGGHRFLPPHRLRRAPSARSAPIS